MTLGPHHLEALLALGLAFLRASAFLAVSPVIGGPAVPPRVRVVAGFALAVVVFPFARADGLPGWEAGSAALAAMAVAEVAVGLTMGFAARLVFAAFQIAASMMETSLGLDAMHVFDPFSQEQEGVLSRFHGAMASLALLAADAHHGLISALARSYAAFPAGAGMPLPGRGLELSRLAAEMLGAGVRMAAPVSLAMLVVALWTALLARAAPQMNPYFALGAAASLGAGLLLLSVVAPLIAGTAGWAGEVMARAAASVAAR